MKAGELVRVKGKQGLSFEVPPVHDYWGETARVLFFDGTSSEWEKALITYIQPLKSGGYGVDQDKKRYGRNGNELAVCRDSQ